MKIIGVLVFACITIAGCLFLTFRSEAQSPRELRLKYPLPIVVDANDAEVATILDLSAVVDATLAHGFVILGDGRTVPIYVYTDSIDTIDGVYFETADCSGTAYIPTSQHKTLLPQSAFSWPRTTLYAALPNSTSEHRILPTRRTGSGNGECLTDPIEGLSVPAASTGIEFGHFVPPFRIIMRPNSGT